MQYRGMTLKLQTKIDFETTFLYNGDFVNYLEGGYVDNFLREHDFFNGFMGENLSKI